MQITLSKKIGESAKEYKLRICEYKDSGVLEMNWDEVADLINSETDRDYSSSKYRKDYQIITNHQEVILKKYNKTDLKIEEMKALKNELYKEKQKLRDERNSIRRDLRDQARVESMLDEFKAISKEVAQENPFVLDEYQEIVNDGSKGVLLLSDWHYNHNVNNHYNKYNRDIAFERIDRLADKTIEYCKKYNVTELLVLQLGDLVSGLIQKTVRIEKNAKTSKEVVEVAEILANFIKKLAQHINIKYSGLEGNHSSFQSKYQDRIDGESFHKFIRHHIETRVKYGDLKDRVELLYSESIIHPTIGYLEYAGKKLFFSHGDNDSPRKVYKNAIGMVGKVDRIYLGHRHTRFEMNEYGTRILFNGSLCGVDGYAIKKRLGSNSQPSQTLEIFGDDRITVDISVDKN